MLTLHLLLGAQTSTVRFPRPIFHLPLCQSRQYVLKFPIHVRVWLASLTREPGSDIYIYIIGQSPAYDTPHKDEFDLLEPEPSRTR
jgi:hypothetical protein